MSTTVSTLFSSSFRNHGLGLLVAGVIFFLVGVGGSGALYGSYVQTASAQVPAVTSARV